MYRIGLDVGGTFTDFVVQDLDSGRLHNFKVSSTNDDPSRAIEEGVGHAINVLGVPADEIVFIGHGTTVATNMVIERRGVPTGLITTRGFRDILDIQRQVRPNNYDHTEMKPRALAKRAWRIEIDERVTATGEVLVPLDEQAVVEAADLIVSEGGQAIAVCFLHAYLAPDHERRARDLIAARYPDLYVSVSSDIVPEFREFERFSTTVINAHVGPRMTGYVDRLTGRMRDIGVPGLPYTFHSNGGLMSVDMVRTYPVRTCLSGPAGGVVGAAQVGAATGVSNLITFDVGGTSTDVSLIVEGRPAFTSQRDVAGYPILASMLDVHVVGAGGGSIARIDAGGALKVGPESAGASPGPVSFGRGGTVPTLTDANIVLQRLSPEGLLGGGMKVDQSAARRAIAEQLADPLDISVEEAAMGIIRIGVANMSRAIRNVSTEKGYDVKDFSLFAYGGAGPLHASDVAASTSIPRVLVPLAPGTMSARGILMADVSTDFVRSRVVAADAEGWADMLAQFRGMEAEGDDWFAGNDIPAADRSCVHTIDARYRGQNHEVRITVPSAPDEGMLGQFLVLFRDAHEREYGYHIDGLPVEIVNRRLKVTGHIQNPARTQPLEDRAPAAPFGTRQVYFVGGWRDTALYRREDLAVGQVIPGPAIIEELTSTTVLNPSDRASLDKDGNIVIEVRT